MAVATEENVLPVVQEVAHAELDRMFPGEEITLRQLLEATAEILDDPKHWTTGALAKNDKGQSVGPTDPTATCWCAIGATYKAFHVLTNENVYGKTGAKGQDRLVLKITQRLMQSASRMLVGRRVESMNDGNTGREDLQRVMPLALSIIEHAIENQQGALGEALGTVGIVDPENAPDEHEHVQNLEPQNGGSGTGAPMATDELAAAGQEPVQSQEGSPPTDPKAEGSQGSSSAPSQDVAGGTDSATSATGSTTDSQ